MGPPICPSGTPLAPCERFRRHVSNHASHVPEFGLVCSQAAVARLLVTAKALAMLPDSRLPQSLCWGQKVTGIG